MKKLWTLLFTGLIGLTAGLLASQATGLAGASAAPQTERRYFPGSNPELPFSNAVLAGDTLYLAGRIGVDPETGQAPAELDREIHLMLDSMQAALDSAGLTMDDLVYVTVYCPDLSLYDRFNAIYRTYFKKHFPARAFIGSGKLLRNGHFEIQGIAVRQ